MKNKAANQITDNSQTKEIQMADKYLEVFLNQNFCISG